MAFDVILNVHSIYLNPAKDGKLIESAVCLCLANLVSLLIPLALMGISLHVFDGEHFGAWLVLLFGTWLAQAIYGCMRAVRHLKSATEVNASTRALHSIQYVAIAVFLVMACKKSFDFSFLMLWLMTVEIFIFLFFLCYFSLAIPAKIKLPFSSFFGFLLVTGSLAYTLMKIG